MGDKVFTVKHQSVREFIANNLLVQTKHAGTDRLARVENQVSVYHLMADELLFSKSEEIKPGMKVIFTLEDRAQNSCTTLVNTYTYEVLEYDDVSNKLRLTDFKVELLKVER